MLIPKEYFKIIKPEPLFNARIIDSKGNVIFPFVRVGKSDAETIERLVKVEVERGCDCRIEITEVK